MKTGPVLYVIRGLVIKRGGGYWGWPGRNERLEKKRKRYAYFYLKIFEMGGRNWGGGCQRIKTDFLSSLCSEKNRKEQER